MKMTAFVAIIIVSNNCMILNARKSYIDSIKEILPDTPKNGLLKHWIPTARNKEEWDTLISNWKKAEKETLIREHENPNIHNNHKRMSRLPRHATESLNNPHDQPNINTNPHAIQEEDNTPPQEDPEYLTTTTIGYLPTIHEE